jgi:hypothetical protein
MGAIGARIAMPVNGGFSVRGACQAGRMRSRTRRMSDRLSGAQLCARIAEHAWFHSIALRPGLVTPGG